MDKNCAYCMENELLDAFGIKICELSQSKVYLFKEQTLQGAWGPQESIWTVQRAIGVLGKG